MTHPGSGYCERSRIVTRLIERSDDEPTPRVIYLAVGLFILLLAGGVAVGAKLLGRSTAPGAHASHQFWHARSER